MLAVVKYGHESGMVELRDVPVPEIGDNDVLLEVKAVGVCGSDVEMWRSDVTFAVNVPVIQGHEFCGVVAQTGKNVDKWRQGDKAISETSAYVCGKCYFCKSGDYNMCPHRLGYGYGVDGAFTRFVKVRQEILHPIPPGLSFEEAAITEPVCVAYNALVFRSRIRPGDTVAVIGPGPIGLNCIQVARISGAGTIIVSGKAVDRTRLQLAKKMGADITVDCSKEDPVAVVNQSTSGLGADLVVNAAGDAPSLEQSMQMARRLGQITKIGWGPEPVSMSLDPLISKAIALQGSYGHSWKTWRAVLELLEKRTVSTKPMISTILPITEWETAYRQVEDRSAVKVILKPVD
jgi:alcohol dehydrogenase/L-iditol 2-dehydrogenase